MLDTLTDLQNHDYTQNEKANIGIQILNMIRSTGARLNMEIFPLHIDIEGIISKTLNQNSSLKGKENNVAAISDAQRQQIEKSAVDAYKKKCVVEQELEMKIDIGMLCNKMKTLTEMIEKNLIIDDVTAKKSVVISQQIVHLLYEYIIGYQVDING